MSNFSGNQLVVDVSEIHSSTKTNRSNKKINYIRTLKKMRIFLVKPLIFIFIFLFTWGICGSCIFPPSNFFSLFLLYVFSVYCGEISEILHLPDLFGNFCNSYSEH